MASLSQTGEDEYRGFVETLALLDMEGWQRFEGKA